MNKKELLQAIEDMPDDAEILYNDGFDYEPYYNSAHNQTVEYIVCDKESNAVILTHWL